MTKRDEYVATLKAQLDRWNTEIGHWETQAKAATKEAQTRYAKELEVLAARREKARYTLRLVEDASASAWDDLRRGTDEAWDRMNDAVKQARAHFERQPPAATK
jgi:hypothetical protein